MAQVWTFETPINVSATNPVNLTWNPRTFNSVKYGNFLLNLWLLRDDAQGDTVVSVHLPYLLAGDHNVYNYSVLWTPTLDDIDINVPEAGIHQLAWEQSRNNPGLDPFNITFEGYSRGFNVKAPISSNSSSTVSSTSILSTTSPTTSAPTITSRPQESTTSSSYSSSTNTPTIIGLVAGLSLLFLLFIGAAIWGVRKYQSVQKQAPSPANIPPAYPSTDPKLFHNSMPNSVPNLKPPGKTEAYRQRGIKPVE